MQQYRDLSERVPSKVAAEEVKLEVEEPKTIDELCTKCGWYEADFEFIGSSVIKLQSIDGGVNIQKVDNAADDIMLMTCRRCGFQWTTSPLEERVEAKPENNVDDPHRHNISGAMNRPAGHRRNDGQNNEGDLVDNSGGI